MPAPRGIPEGRLRAAPDWARHGRPDDRDMSAVETAPRSRRLDRVSVADAMTSGVISCMPETPLHAVAKIMSTRSVHAVYVFDYGREDDETVELWGLVGDLDVAAAAGAGLEERTARDAAVTPLVVIHSDEPLKRAAALMADQGVSHLAVLDPLSDRPVGVVSTLDIAGALATTDTER